MRQLNNGPARGVFQVEPKTFDWLKEKYTHRFPILEGATSSNLEWDLRLSILVARLRYLVVLEPFPAADQITHLGVYWKQYYNTPAGSGTVPKFVKNYNKYVKEV